MSDAFNGLGMNLGNLSRLSKAKTRSISAENQTGEKGKGGMSEPDPKGPSRDLGVGWKCRPCVMIKPSETYILADIEGPGAIQSMWFAGYVGRDLILRFYWDNQSQPSIEVPLSDFFGMPWVLDDMTTTNGPMTRLNSVPVAVNPNRGLNCFWEMPFREHCKITIENLDQNDEKMCFHQINYTLTEVPDDCAYFHAQFRKVNPLPKMEDYVILDGVRGQGHYVGTSMGWGINNNGWWGEGEIKFFIDGDEEFPTICGTGVEDYFGGAWGWKVDGEYQVYSTPFVGMHEVLPYDGIRYSPQRHSMYRWHIMDPIRFVDEIKITMQSLGWRRGTRYHHQQHDISSVAYWYQTLPSPTFPELPDRDCLEIV